MELVELALMNGSSINENNSECKHELLMLVTIKSLGEVLHVQHINLE